MSALGHVTFNPERGNFQGRFLTMNVSVGIDIVPIKEKTSAKQPDYRVFTENGFELGAGWKEKAKSTGNEYVSLTLSAPELGRKIFANLGRAGGQDDEDVFAIIWNPDQ